MLHWQPYKVFNWVWLRHDFTKLKATRTSTLKFSHTVCQSLSGSVSCRLWASHPPAGLDQQHCTWRSHGCVLAGLSPTALKTATHTHLPINDTFMRVSVCVHTPCHSWEKCERHRLWTSWETQDDSAKNEARIGKWKRSLGAYIWNISVLKSRCNRGFTILRIAKHLAY